MKLSGNKKLDKMLIAIIGLLALFFTIVFFMRGQYKDKLRKEGIVSKVKVLDKERLRSSKGKTKATYLYIALFENDADVPKNIEKEKLEKENKSIDDKIDALFANKEDVGKIGKYKKIKIAVPTDRFSRIQIGDWVEFVYLKDQPEKGLLKEVL